MAKSTLKSFTEGTREESMHWIDNLMMYQRFGNRGRCPRCESRDVEVSETRYSFGKVSVCFHCYHCGSTGVFDGCGGSSFCESVNLTDIPTCELVEELRGREGVESKIAEPYEDTGVSVNGPAILLVVTD